MTEPTQEEVLRRLMYPTPPINTQQGRWLYEELYGPQEWPRKRCAACEGEGYHRRMGLVFTCDECSGTGKAK